MTSCRTVDDIDCVIVIWPGAIDDDMAPPHLLHPANSNLSIVPRREYTHGAGCGANVDCSKSQADIELLQPPTELNGDLLVRW